MNELLTHAEQNALASIERALNEEDPEVSGGIWADCEEVAIPVLLTAVARLSQRLRHATRAHYAWPAPLPFPAQHPGETQTQYYCLRERFPTQPMFLTWLHPDEDYSLPPAWHEWDGDCYVPTTRVVTHFWPVPVVGASAAPTPPPTSPWIPVGVTLPEVMPDEAYGFDSETDEAEKNGERCSEDVLVSYRPRLAPQRQDQCLARFYIGSKFWYDQDGKSIRVTHWQPLTNPAQDD